MNRHRLFRIDDRTVIHTPYFKLKQQKVEYATLLAESNVPLPSRSVYFKSGLCSAIVQLDKTTLYLYYSSRTVWDNRLFQSWLRKQLKKAFSTIAENLLYERFAYWEDQTSLKATSLNLRHLRGRELGACYDDGVIELDPKIALISKDSIDYVILHELAHLRYLDHRPVFWEYLASLLQDDVWKRTTQTDLEFHAIYPHYTLFFR